MEKKYEKQKTEYSALTYRLLIGAGIVGGLIGLERITKKMHEYKSRRLQDLIDKHVTDTRYRPIK